MNCWHCNTELIWGGAHDIEEENYEYSIVSNLSCPECHCLVEVYYPSEKLLEEIDREYKNKNDFLEEAEKEKKELEESYQESIRQTKERTK